MKHRMTSTQSGFSLIEMAIVLVIAGILLVGVLEGQSLIDDSKSKGVVTEMKAMQSAYNKYIETYKAIPGDEAAATMTARGWAGAVGSAAVDGALVIPEVFAAPTAEHQAFLRAMRGSGLIGGSPTNVALVTDIPKNSAGGMLDVATATVATPVFGFTSGTFICASGLPTKIVRQMDTLIDGALPATQIGNNVGLLRAQPVATPGSPYGVAAAAVAYNEALAAANANPWTACMKIS